MGKRGNVHVTLEIGMSTVKGPIREGGVREERRTFLEGRENTNDEGIGWCGGGDRLGKSKIESIDNDQVRNNGGSMVIGRCINIIFAGEGVGRAHLRTWDDHPFDVKVLKE